MSKKSLVLLMFTWALLSGWFPGSGNAQSEMEVDGNLKVNGTTNFGKGQLTVTGMDNYGNVGYFQGYRESSIYLWIRNNAYTGDGHMYGLFASNNGSVGWSRCCQGNVVTLTPDHKLGVGLAITPTEQLDVGGVVRLRTTAAPSVYSSGAYMWADSSDGQFKVRDSRGNVTTTSPHDDPKLVIPNAKSSFDDPLIELPFSFHHQNVFIGKGEVIDMARLVAWTQEKMQAELGEEAGKLIHRYDLPKEEVVDLSKWEEAVTEQHIAEIMAEIDSLPWIKVSERLGKIPPEAVEEVNEVQTVQKNVVEERQILDFETMEIKLTKYEKTVDVEVPTGRKIKRLRQDWELREEGLYRKPTLHDLTVVAGLDEELVKAAGIQSTITAPMLEQDQDTREAYQNTAEHLLESIPQLPKWVQNRLSHGIESNQNISELMGQIRQIIEARATENGNGQLAKAN